MKITTKLEVQSQQFILECIHRAIQSQIFSSSVTLFLMSTILFPQPFFPQKLLQNYI